MTHGAMVLFDADSFACLCPYHGSQDDAAYAEGVAPCGCVWQFDKHSVLRAQRADAETLQHAIPLTFGGNNDGSE